METWTKELINSLVEEAIGDLLFYEHEVPCGLIRIV